MPPFKCPTPCHKFTIATESFRITTESRWRAGPSGPPIQYPHVQLR
jgi:hypothetical protein